MSEKKESGSGKVYACKLCKKTFKQKCDYDKHANKKAPCISLAACEAIIVKKDEMVDSKKELTTFFKNCLDLLRDNEGLTGEKALRNLSYLLILKLLEPHFGGIIDIDNYQFDFKISEDDSEDVIIHNKARLLSCVRFSNLSKENEDNIPNIMKYLWDIILSVHPSTKNIFLTEKKFDIQRQSTYKKIVDKLNRIDLSCIENDILGDSYEEVIQYIMTGKVLGQFFTPLLIKKFMVGLIDPQIFPNGKIESCCDPTMGTGGFLIEYIRIIQEKAKLNDISLDWQFIKNCGLYGKELEPDTYQLAISNMLISTGHMFEKLDRGDSIREPITQKFDIILSNPPFGIKGLKYDDFNSDLKDQYVPIKTDNAVSLFIQAIIFMLKIGGKCAIVLPDGKDLFTKTNTTLVAVREYLMKTCDLKEIYLLPSGIFEHTTIKTCVFYFVKRREGSDALRIKTQKKTSREYEFSKTLITKNVQFYDYNPYENVKNLLADVPIEKIASNSYSLNYSDYLRDDAEEEQYENGIIVKTLGELFKLNGNGKTNSKDITNTGEYPFYKASCNNPSGTHNTFDFDGIEYLLIIKSGGSSSKPISDSYGIGKVFEVRGKCAANIAVFQLLPKTNNNFKYLSYYLKSIQNKIQGLAKYCTNNGNIDMKELMEIKIPIPSIERQKEIVKYLDFIYEKANKTSYEKIAELKQLNEFYLNNQKMFGDNIVKTLGEVCDIDYGTRIVKGNIVEGEYPVYGSGRAMFSTNTFNREGFNILIGRFALSSECVRLINEKIFLNDSGLTVIPKISILLHKYIGYYLFHNQNCIYNCSRGTAQKNLEMDIFKLIKIPIPSLQRQKEIVAYCEINEALIKQLENEIEINKKEAQQFLKNAVAFQCQEEDD
jgi:type I restriction-modification system DNA methylase subunit